MNSVILSTVIFTLVPGPFQEQERSSITIFIDSTSKDYDIRRRSLIAKQELTRPHTRLTKERFYIDNYWNVEFIEKVDRYLIQVPEIPCYRFGKGEWRKFEPCAFAASGIFTLNMYTICKLSNYDIQYRQWKFDINGYEFIDGVAYRNPWKTESATKRNVYKIQPPKVPPLEPRLLVFYYKDIFFIEALTLFERDQWDTIPIQELIDNITEEERNIHSVLGINVDPFNRNPEGLSEFDEMVP